MDKSSGLGIPMSPQDISKKYKRQILGMPEASPSSSTKISGHISRHYIFIASYISYSRSVNYFCFQFCFVLFAIAYGWILAYFVWRDSRLIAMRWETPRGRFDERSSKFSLSMKPRLNRPVGGRTHF